MSASPPARGLAALFCSLAITCGGAGRKAPLDDPPPPRVEPSPAAAPAPAPRGPCGQWWGCAAFGLCELDGDVCRPARDEDCALSWSCRAYGYCRIHDGVCSPVPKAGSCRDLGTEKLDACDISGRCVALDGLCLASEAKHCDPTSACTNDGLCDVVEGVCAKRGDDAACRDSDACKRRGLCRSRAGRCVSSSDEDCAASEGCSLYGACRRYGDQCLAGDVKHCRASQGCREAYRCTYEHGYCWASAADCAGAKECDGGCPHERGDCVLPPKPFIYFKF